MESAVVESQNEIEEVATVDPIEEAATNAEEEQLTDELNSLHNDAKNDESASVEIESQPTVIDDFIRNFLISNEMHSTLDVFQREWYDRQMSQKDSNELVGINAIPDIYRQKQSLEDKVRLLEYELERTKSVTAKVKTTWEKLRKERDFHRMHHRRVTHEKNDLVKQLRRLKKYCDSYEPTIRELKSKYENAMKDKMLMRINRDKIAMQLETTQTELDTVKTTVTLTNDASNRKQSRNDGSAPPPKPTKQSQTQTRENAEISAKNIASRKAKPDTALPIHIYENPYLDETLLSATNNSNVLTTAAERFQLFKTVESHSMAIPRLSLHPQRDIVATVSDDMTWKLWNLPNGELILSGEGHKDWVSDSAFHPMGTFMVTSSGDTTVKLWDFAKSACISTYDDHTQAVWSVSFHHDGNFMASSSMDQTCRLWDVQTSKCRQTYRGHVDSVNYVCFQPYSHNLCTASSDKTLSFWDLRTGLCIQTFYGHHNSLNHVSFSSKGDLVSSADADGIVKVWDIRMIKELSSIDAGKLVHPCSESVFDQSGKRVIVTCDDGMIKIFETESGKLLSSLAGHDDSVNAIVFSHKDNMLVSVGNDGTLRIWQ